MEITCTLNKSPSWILGCGVKWDSSVSCGPGAHGMLQFMSLLSGSFCVSLLTLLVSEEFSADFDITSCCDIPGEALDNTACAGVSPAVFAKLPTGVDTHMSLTVLHECQIQLPSV